MNENQKLQVELLYQSQKKEKWISILLCFIFGPFGFIYTYSWGGFFTGLVLISILYFCYPFFLLGETFLFFALTVIYLVMMAWLASDNVDEYNEKLRKRIETTFNN